MLASAEVYRRVKPVEIASVLAVLPQMPFVDICVGSTDPNHPPCAVVVPSTVPREVLDFIEGLELGGAPHRVFLRRLGPGQGIPPHIDSWIPVEANIQRFHVPLVSHPDVTMRWPDDMIEVHLETGWLWEVRYNRLHEVVNPTDTERVHIQIDQVGATI